MKLHHLLAIAFASLSCGCSCLIAGAGKDLSRHATKEEIHAELGEPVAKGVQDDQEYEEFFTRQVIAQDRRVKLGYAMLLGMTCGACELVCVPYELCRLGGRTLLGQTIRVTYSAEGYVNMIERDGEPPYIYLAGWSAKNRRRDAAP